MEYLFIYGTLKGHHLMDGVFIGNVTTKDLFKTNEENIIPYIVKDKDGIKIPGELWLVDKKTIKQLDNYEGTPDLFKRENVTISDQGFIKFSELKVQAYMYQEKGN